MEKKLSKYGYLYILPFFIVFILFSIYPIVYTLYLSFTSYSGFTDPKWIGFDNYAIVLQDNLFWKSLLNTIRIWGVNFVLQILLALILVMIFSDLKYKVKGLKVFRIIFYLPNLVAATSVALIFVKLLDNDYGIINKFLFKFHLITKSIGWLDNTFLAQLSVSNIQTWMWFGNSFILFIAAVHAVNKEVLEASLIDGAGRFKILLHVKLPLIKPILIYVGVTGLIGGLQLFDIPYLITDGQGAPNNSLSTVIVYLYNMGFTNHKFGRAAAIAYILFLIIVFISGIFISLMYKGEIQEKLKNKRKRKMEVN